MIGLSVKWIMGDEEKEFELLDGVISNLKSELRDTRKERDKHKTENEEMKKRLNDMFNQISILQNENEALKKTIESKVHYERKCEEKLTSLQKNYDQCVQQLVSLRANIDKIPAGHDRMDKVMQLITQMLNSVQLEVHDVKKEIKPECDRIQEENVDADALSRHEIEALKDLDLCTQFEKDEVNFPADELAFQDDDSQKYKIIGDIFLGGAIKKESFKNEPFKMEMEKENNFIVIPETVPEDSEFKIEGPRMVIRETVLDDYISSDSDFGCERTPVKKTLISDVDKSPVLGLKKQDSFLKDNGNIKNDDKRLSPIRAVDQRYLLKNVPPLNLLITPTKRTASQAADSTSIRTLTPNKRSRKSPVKSQQKTPVKKSPAKTPRKKSQKTPVKKSPAKPLSQLKKAHSLDVEVTHSGQQRKFRQTKLNVDTFKATDFEKQKENEHDEDVRIQRAVELSTKQNGDDVILESPKRSQEKRLKNEEDDVIFESPKRSEEKSLDSFTRSNKLASGRNSNEKAITAPLLSQPPANSGFDPEETYVSSSFLNNFELHKKSQNVSESKIFAVPQSKKPVPANGAPFPYKRDAVRKKSERNQLPGQECHDCVQYYRAAYGDDFDPVKLQQILNKCSRHRDHFPEISDTPDNFWKPYLTSSITDSALDDNT